MCLVNKEILTGEIKAMIQAVNRVVKAELR